MCTKCVDLTKGDWITISKARRRKLRRRKSADTPLKQGQRDIMENEGEQGQLLSQAQPPLSGVVATQPATPYVSEDEYEPMTQETHTQGKSSSALQRLEKDLIDPDVDDFQGDPPTARHGSRASSEISSATDSESDDEPEEDSSKEVSPQLSRHGSVARESDQDESIKKKPEFVATSPSPFLAHLANQRALEVQSAPKANEVASLASSGFSKKDMASYIFTSGDIQTLPPKSELVPTQPNPTWTRSVHINWLELRTVLIALQRMGQRLQNKLCE